MRKQLLLLLSMFLLVSGSLFAQGVTTSSLTGIVVDDNGAPVMLASVLAVHTPTGTQYGTYTSEDGHFDIRNMKIGGPYKVTVSFIGYENASVEDIFLQLNNPGFVKLQMKATATQLSAVVVSGGQNLNRDKQAP